jgi:hypothetical protein
LASGTSTGRWEFFKKQNNFITKLERKKEGCAANALGTSFSKGVIKCVTECDVRGGGGKKIRKVRTSLMDGRYLGAELDGA